MTPERLTGLDASFLYMETPTLHMHVAMTAVFDPSTVPGRVLVPADPPAHQRPHPPGAGVPAPTGGGADAARPSRLGGRPRVRHRQPPPAGRAAVPWGHARAGRLRGRRHQPPAPPRPPALGDVDRGGARGREDRAGRQDAPQHHRRRVRRGAAERPLRPRARPAADAPADGAPTRLAHPVRLSSWWPRRWRRAWWRPSTSGA